MKWPYPLRAHNNHSASQTNALLLMLTLFIFLSTTNGTSHRIQTSSQVNIKFLWLYIEKLPMTFKFIPVVGCSVNVCETCEFAHIEMTVEKRRTIMQSVSMYHIIDQTRLDIHHSSANDDDDGNNVQISKSSKKKSTLCCQCYHRCPYRICTLRFVSRFRTWCFLDVHDLYPATAGASFLEFVTAHIIHNFDSLPVF